MFSAFEPEPEAKMARLTIFMGFCFLINGKSELHFSFYNGMCVDKTSFIIKNNLMIVLIFCILVSISDVTETFSGQLSYFISKKHKFD